MVLRRDTRGLMACVLVPAATLVAGCASAPPRAAIGTALRAYGRGDLAVGDEFRDFALRDAAGQITHLSAIHGRVTVLAFSPDPNWPDCGDARALAELGNSAAGPWVDVLVVSVGHPAEPCPDALAPAADCEIPLGHLYLICDPYGQVSRLYGPDAIGRYYVLTNFLKIAAVGDVSDRNGLRAATKRVVDSIHDQDVREGLYDRCLSGRY